MGQLEQIQKDIKDLQDTVWHLEQKGFTRGLGVKQAAELLGKGIETVYGYIKNSPENGFPVSGPKGGPVMYAPQLLKWDRDRRTMQSEIDEILKPKN